ncbi:MAG: Ldh family oxidoreductase, partial [Theionarchaea archaeon]|nr:Ldh family oxidoreductase [Theionarchaea archaeon]
DSHGILRLPQYLEEMGRGLIRPGHEPSIIGETPSTATVDGHWGFGQVNARWATELAIEKARKTSLSAVALVNNNHIGRLGEYTLIAAREGMIGMMVSTGGSRRGQVAPYGGRERRLNTCPISVGIPAGKYEPFLMDFATSVAAEGKVFVKLDAGESMPEGWVIDGEGNPTTDPQDYARGGALLPFGGHKGYSLALFIDIMAGILSGAGYATSPRSKEGNSVFVMVLDVSSFRPRDEFEREMEEYLDHMRSTPPLPGHERVIIPGEPELQRREKRLKEGINIPDGTWERLVEASGRLGLDITGYLD